jgi:hypothetical protein
LKALRLPTHRRSSALLKRFSSALVRVAIGRIDLRFDPLDIRPKRLDRVDRRRIIVVHCLVRPFLDILA